jgi:hypothetical protein
MGCEHVVTFLSQSIHDLTCHMRILLS